MNQNKQINNQTTTRILKICVIYFGCIIYMFSFWNSKKISSTNLWVINMISLITWILIILSFTKLYSSAPKYLAIVTGYVRFFVCLFLIIKFNPFYTFGLSGFTDFDRRIVYISGMIILTTDTNIIEIIHKFIDKYIYKMDENTQPQQPIMKTIPQNHNSQT